MRVMDNTFVIAVLTISGCFIVAITAILKSGVEGAKTIFSSLGFALGAIISFYFTDQAKAPVIQAAITQAQEAQKKSSAATSIISQLELQKTINENKIKQILDELHTKQISSNKLLEIEGFITEQANADQIIKNSISEFKRKYGMPNTPLNMEDTHMELEK